MPSNGRGRGRGPKLRNQSSSKQPSSSSEVTPSCQGQKQQQSNSSHTDNRPNRMDSEASRVGTPDPVNPDSRRPPVVLPTASWICSCGMCIKSAKEFMSTIRNSNGVYGATVTGAGPAYEAATNPKNGNIFFAAPGAGMNMGMGTCPQGKMTSPMLPGGQYLGNSGSQTAASTVTFKHGDNRQPVLMNGFGASNGCSGHMRTQPPAFAGFGSSISNDEQTNGKEGKDVTEQPAEHIPNGYVKGASKGGNPTRHHRRTGTMIGNEIFDGQMNGYSNQHILYTIPENRPVAPFPSQQQGQVKLPVAVIDNAPPTELTNGEEQRTIVELAKF